MAEKTKLTTKQTRAIPILLGARTYGAGCKAARISKATFYGWMGDEAFRTEFERKRNELATVAFGILAQNLSKAIEVLVEMLNAGDDRCKRLSANDIIRHFLKHKEIKELEDRLAAIEERLEAR
jgi:hypothetical protein